jgi:transposase
MNAYSVDLRQRVLAAVDAGLPRCEIVHLLGVSLSTIERLVRLRRATGHLAPKPRPGAKRRISLEQQAALAAPLHLQPDATLEQHCQQWPQEQQVTVSRATMWRALRRAGWTRKKRV